MSRLAVKVARRVVEASRRVVKSSRLDVETLCAFRMIEVVNRQRRLPMDCERWRAFVAKALRVVPARGAGVTVAFVSDRAMRELNRRWRGRRGTTDVLSFPVDATGPAAGPRELGDVVVCASQASDELEAVVHGVLHLCGYDHETDAGEMLALQSRVMDALR